MTGLQDDLWHMICTQLRHQRDLNTLFNCACSGKQLAPIALPNIYRMHVIASDLYGSGERTPKYWKKQAGLWRTLFFSSLGKTLYPYCQHIRTLNLRDLYEVLRHMFGNRNYDDFFQGELLQFKVQTCAEVSWLDQLDAVEIIGEAITKQTPLLEELTGSVRRETLSRWIPRLPRLTHLKQCDGTAVEGNGNLIRLHCPLFKGLHFRRSRHLSESQSDQALATFLNELRPQSLQSFGAEEHNTLGPQTFQALSSHGKSLIKLNLDILACDFMSKVSLLKGCTNLVSFSLGRRAFHSRDFQEIHTDAVLETIAWLKKCKRLRKLRFGYFPIAAALMKPVFSGKSVHLTSVHYEVVDFRSTQAFFTALADQTSLEFLTLNGLRKSYMEPGRAGILVDCLSKLVKLKYLSVNETFGNISDLHFVRLASCLPKLERWWTNGKATEGELTDAIWDAVASLGSLRLLEITAMIRFTAGGILDLIEKLGPGNKGLFLSVTDLDRGFSKKKQKLIQERIREKVGGTFRFVSKNDPNNPNLAPASSEIESD